MSTKQPNPYQIRQKQLKRMLFEIERQIAFLEEDYLTRTKFCGNVLRGFSSYILEKTLMIHSDQKINIRNSDRIFSLSSTTSPVSRDRSSEKPIHKPQRITRTSFKKFIEEIEEENQTQILEQWSVDSCYERQGSLFKHPQSAEIFLPQYRSEGDTSRTIQEDPHFQSIETESMTSVKFTKLQRKNSSQKRKNRRKAKNQPSNNAEIPKISQIQPQSMDIQAPDFHQVNLKSEQQQFSQGRSSQCNESCDSIELFMRMASQRQ